MICKHCQSTIPDTSKFCPNCGAKIEQEESVGNKEWYFVEDNESKGTYYEEEMVQYYKAGRINENTYVWKSGLETWVRFKETGLMALVTDRVVEEAIDDLHAAGIQEDDSNSQQGTEWFYISPSNEQVGPISEKDIISMIQNKTLSPTTYVWTAGMTDWVFVKQSPLAIYMDSRKKKEFKEEKPKGISPEENYSETKAFAAKSNAQTRNIGLYLVLSIVTCGIFMIYWLYSIARDVDDICRAHNQPVSQFPPMVHVALIYVTCGLYGLYFFYTSSKKLHSISYNNGYRAPDDSIINMILVLFGLMVVANCIIQSCINDIHKYSE